MIWYKSLKVKSIAYTLLVMIIPLILLGAAGTLYNYTVLKQNIQKNELDQARTIAFLTDSYMGRTTSYLEGKSQNYGLIDALRQNDSASIKSQIMQFKQSTSAFYWIFMTDQSGKVIASSPHGDIEGKTMEGNLIIRQPVKSGKTFIYGPMTSVISGRPSIFVSTPVLINGTIAGVLVGAIDDNNYLDVVRHKEASLPLEHAYIVNNTGHIIIHNNSEYISTIKDFSAVPIVRDVLQGREGVREYEDPIEGGRWLGAYTPLLSGNGGVIVSLPVEEAYRPVRETIWMLLAGLIFFTIIAGIVAIIIGDQITRPIRSIAAATRHVGKKVDLSKYLPYDRDDELGRLADDFRAMSERITLARNKILMEKKFTDIKLDVMGHDINNLNQVIMADLELIQQYDNLNEQQNEYLRGALDATTDSAGLIRNVKAIQAVTRETGKTEKIDLCDVIEDCIKNLKRPQHKKITINFRREPGKYVSAVPDIRLAYSNVIENSVRYSGPEVVIDITVSEILKDGIGYYETAIVDNGNGIPDNVKATLFSRFREETTAPPGRGLGLLTVKVLVEHSGGRVLIENRITGDHRQGTRVTIDLPVASASEG